MERVRVLGCPVDVVDLTAAAERLAELADAPPGSARIVITLNPEMVMRARRESDFARVVENSALNVPDGIGLVRAAKRRGTSAERVPGVDLVDKYLDHAVSRKHKVALVGGRPGVAEVAAMRYRAAHAGLNVFADGGDPDEKTASRVAQMQPDVIFAAYGPGKQEMFLSQYLPVTGARVGMGVGGTFDFVAGRVKRAPRIVRGAGMEWAWRLARQPWRWRRQLDLPKFWFLERKEQNP
jgi:N-acetylglucosaminyldiphosphoundecaprenol N-acetyl-beta-D-mannosaminyltransferase